MYRIIRDFMSRGVVTCGVDANAAKNNLHIIMIKGKIVHRD